MKWFFPAPRLWKSCTDAVARLGLGVLFLGVAASTGCSKRAEPQGPPVVVASFFPIFDLARQIAGTNATVLCLVPPGGDPHHEETTPDMARAVERARLVLSLGLGMDGWVMRLAGQGGTSRVAVLGQGLAHRRMGVAALSHHSTEPTDPGETDPHVWLDPTLAARLAERIAVRMEEVLPEHSVVIRERGKALVRELEMLHGEFESQLRSVPQRRVVTFHGAYGYLFERYRLETAGVIEVFPGTEPGVEYLKDLVDLLRQLEMKTIFAEPQLPDRPAQVIAREIGGKVERLDPCETVLPERPEAHYQDRQRENLRTLARVLSEGKGGTTR